MCNCRAALAKCLAHDFRGLGWASEEFPQSQREVRREKDLPEQYRWNCRAPARSTAHVLAKHLPLLIPGHLRAFAKELCVHGSLCLSCPAIFVVALHLCLRSWLDSQWRGALSSHVALQRGIHGMRKPSRAACLSSSTSGTELS